MLANKSIATILEKKETASLRVETLGLFQLWRDGNLIPDGDWKRDIAVQLFQFLLTSRNQRSLHKATIIDRLWPDVDEKAGNRNFKAALHQLTKVIEPEKSSRDDSRFLLRQGQTYRLDTTDLWLDTEALDELIIMGNHALINEPQQAILAYQQAIYFYQGQYLPNRIYDDWCADERERIQVLVLSAMTSLARLQLNLIPQETIRLAALALKLDNTWEEAYRLQIQAYVKEGNRPLAVKTYRKCEQVLQKEFEMEPLPETKRAFEKIKK